MTNKNSTIIMKKLLIFVVCTIYSLLIAGQPVQSTANSLGRVVNDLKIDIRASTASMNGNGNYEINIDKRADFIKIVYKLTNRVNYKGLLENKRYQEIKKYRTYPLNTTTRKDSLAKINAEFSSLFESYTSYDKDSLIVNAHLEPQYTQLLYDINKTNTDSLENKNWHVLDGTAFSFKITNGRSTRMIFADSPTAKSNPMLYQLLTQTLELYRSIKMNTFLNTDKTEGY